MKKVITKISVLGFAMLSLSISANAQWTRNSGTLQTYLTNTGDNVGIGTANPAFKLDVQSTGNASMSFKSTNATANLILDRGNSANTASVSYRLLGSGQWQTGCVNTNNFQIRNIALGTPALVVQSTTNNVGIGTANTPYKLTINSAAEAIGLENNAFISAKNTAGVYEFHFWPCVNDNKTYMNHGSAGFDIRNHNGVTTMFISPTHTVGIGTSFASTVPTERLEVEGNIKAIDGDIYLGPLNGSINAGGGLLDANVNMMTDFDNHAVVNGDEDLYIGNDLEVGTQAYKPGGGVWTTISDARLKKDVKSYSDGLEQLMKINPVTFKYNDKVKFLNPDKEYVGIIAQDIQKIAPYMVEEKALFSKSHEDKDGNVVVDDAGQNYLTYDGSALTYMLVNAVKEQNGMIEKVQTENEALKQQLKEMQECVQSLCENSSQSKTANPGPQTAYLLFQNQPNPFNQSTVIGYQLLNNDANAKIIIRDLSGNLVKQVAVAQSGKGQVTINANELSQGTYTYTLEVNGASVDTKLMVVTK